MTLATTIKHLRAIQTDSSEITPVRRYALAEAIAWLTGERQREIRADMRGKVIDHLDGNIYNNDLSNLRVVTMKENRRNR